MVGDTAPCSNVLLLCLLPFPACRQSCMHDLCCSALQQHAVACPHVHAGDSELSLAAVYHVHCRHGDGDFSKFEFFSHHYDHVGACIACPATLEHIPGLPDTKQHQGRSQIAQGNIFRV